MIRISVSLCMLLFLSLLSAGILPGGKKKDIRKSEPSTLEKYISSAKAASGEEAAAAAPGALWTPSARLTDLARDARASQVNDVVTVVVTETINATATGASTSERATSVNSSIASLAGPRATALSSLANISGDQKINGTGTTTRGATLTAVLSARVVSVLPGGLLLVEGSKDLQVNSEQQLITVRGIIRITDITTNNTVASTQIADMEIRLNGKGIVGDAIRRPNALYRFLLGLLPF
jgi:flagellar L-ring protein precursor FlgH